MFYFKRDKKVASYLLHWLETPFMLRMHVRYDRRRLGLIQFQHQC